MQQLRPLIGIADSAVVSDKVTLFKAEHFDGPDPICAMHVRIAVFAFRLQPTPGGGSGRPHCTV